MAKILQVCAIDGSVNALLKPLILALMDRGHIVHNACTDTGRFNVLREQGLVMFNIHIDRKISPVSNLRSVYELYSLMRREKYDIVHVHTPVAALLGRIAANLAGVKNIVYTAHGFYFHDEMPRKEYHFYYNLEKYFARYFTDWLLLQSREDYELSVKNRFKPANRIIHISNGVDIYNKFNPKLISNEKQIELKKSFGIKEDEIVFSFIGRLVKEKGIFELVRAFKQIKEKVNAKLLLIGTLSQSERDQGSYNVLKEMLDDHRIIETGYRSDIPELLSISDVFVLPSYREGLPRSIIEAMAMGKPIIATNIRGCREEVFDGENGFLVDRQNIDQLSEKMFLLASQPDMRQKFGLKSREIAEELFDEQKVIDKQLDLFERLVGISRSATE